MLYAGVVVVLMKTRAVRIGDFVFEKEEREAVNALMDRNSISEGEECLRFEEGFAGHIGTDYWVTCNSGTSALMLVLQAMKYHSGFNAREGQKILTTPLTYIATSNSIATTGFRPVYVDINEHNFNLSEEQVKEHFEGVDAEEYAGIMPVHLIGYPCNMKIINSIARKHNIPVIEDSAEAHGSIYDGKKTGSLGFAGCFSFYIAHNIQVGEFGAITTNDRELADRCRRLKGNGRLCYCTVSQIHSGRCPHTNMEFNPRYMHDMIGYNFKPMEIQATIGNVQLRKIGEINRRRRENVRHLNDLLSVVQDLLKLPEYSDDVSYLGYPLVVKEKNLSRSAISSFLIKQGIENRPIFNCIPTQQPAYAHLKKEYAGKLPNAEHVGNNGFYVGCHQFLKSDDIEYVAENIIKAVKK